MNNDLISRQMLLEYIHGEPVGRLLCDKYNLDGLIEQLPSAQPKKGRWISADAMFHGVPFYCSECGENTRDTVMGKPRWKFCPMCGAKMGVTE